jgi:hypothetical protein
MRWCLVQGDIRFLHLNPAIRIGFYSKFTKDSKKIYGKILVREDGDQNGNGNKGFQVKKIVETGICMGLQTWEG